MSAKRQTNFHRSKSHKKPPTKFTNQKRTNSKVYLHQNQLSELDVGITQFISKLDGFSGIIKARFSDFQVNEIDCDGKIAKLTDNSIPKQFKIDKQAVCKDSDDVIESPLQHLPQEIWVKLKTLSKSDDMNEIFDFNVDNLTKDERKSIHKLIKEYFIKKICADTRIVDGKKIMLFKRVNGKEPPTRADPWPENLDEYVHFLVYKENLDTLDATMKIGDCLKMNSSNFNYAGVKDRRAKTTQWFSVRKVEPWKLLIKTKQIKNLKIGNICFKDIPLKLGKLYGNRFRIALRNIVIDNEQIEMAINGLKQHGFINYYGLQRFGNDKEVPTFSIGVQLLLGNWKQACEIILKPIECEDPDLDITKAKRVYNETNDPQKALDEFQDNKNRCIEFMLLTGLSKTSANDYVNALENIPRNMRLLYIHSFQSLVWNRVVSKRIEKFGLQVVEGDLILDENDNELIVESIEEDEKTTKPKVKVLTANDLTDHTIYDIVLPLPGYDIVYPDNMKDYYKEILESYGLSLEMPKQKVQTYTLSGTYRKALETAEDLSWKIMHYDDPNSNLIQSDLEALKKLPEPQDVENGKYKALILEFSLKSSSYATMILREILKTDTSSSSHAKLNNYHENNNGNDNMKSSIQRITVEKSNEDDIVDDQKCGLLGDEKKYEEFKNLVFNNVDTSKRKLEDGEDNVDYKKSKTD